MEPHWHIAILGLGLMGSSLAAALKQRGFPGELHGYARRPEICTQALENGLLDTASTNPVEAVRGADLVVVCVPIWSIADLVKRTTPHLKEGTVVTDVGSTKTELLAAVDPCFHEAACSFVGSHPIAGSEKGGFHAVDGDLYAGRLAVVCPQTDTPGHAIASVKALWRAAGSDVIEMSAEAHDAMLASTSHLPHIAAAALVRVVAATDKGTKASFCGTGFKDTTRVASGSADMWADIIDSNRHMLEAELLRFHIELERLMEMLRYGSQNDIRKWLEGAAVARDQMLSPDIARRG